MQCFSGECDEVFSVFKTTLKDVEEFTSPEIKAEGGKKTTATLLTRVAT